MLFASFNNSVLLTSRELTHFKNESSNCSLLEGEEWFDLFLTAEEWSQIKPVDSDKRSNHTLKLYV